MRELLAVGIGGFAGSALRFKVSTSFVRAPLGTEFPWGTFTVNIIGCFLVGLLAELLHRQFPENIELKLLLMTGVLGGFTTFSAFGIETIALTRAGNISIAASYVAASLIVGFAAVWAGIRLGGG